jgi:soluble lytic murein transglycosylase-like protein
MRFPHHLLILGALFGSSLLTLFGFIVSAGASPAANVQAVSSKQAEPQQQANTEAELVASESSESTVIEAVPNAMVKSSQLKPEINAECQVSDKFPESIKQWCDLITAYADQHELEPNLVASMMLQESGGDPVAYSASGAVGLLQVMPRDGLAANFFCVNGPCFASRPTIDELQDPEFNIDYGTRMIAGLIKRTGSVRDGLKSYGPKDVGYYYADKVLAIYNNYQ